MIPFLVVILTASRGLSITGAGLVMAVMSLSYLLSALVGGPLGDRAGRRTAMLSGLALRTAGLAGYAWVAGFPALLGSAALVGLGGGLFLPSAKAGIAALATDENRSAAFSVRGVAANVGTTVGPLVGAVLAPRVPAAMFWLASALHLTLWLGTWALYPPDRPRRPGTQMHGAGQEHRERQGHRGLQGRQERQVLSLFRDRAYLAFSLLSLAIWALYTQLTISIPLRALDIGLGTAASGVIWSLSSVEIILLQVPINNLLLRRLHPLTAIALGAGFLGLGLGMVAFTFTLTGLLTAVGVFTIGEMLVMPTADTVVSDLSPPAGLGAYFGVAAFVWGLGEGSGNLIGARLMDVAGRAGRPWLPWMLYALAGGTLAAATMAVRYWPVARQALRRHRRAKHGRAGGRLEPGQDVSGERASERAASEPRQSTGSEVPPPWMLPPEGQPGVGETRAGNRPPKGEA